MLVEAGDAVAAAKLAGMPLSQIVTGLAQHVDVYDVAAVSTYETSDGELWDYSGPVRDRVGCEIAGYHVAARREDAWDAIVAVLIALDAHHPDCFVTLMRAVRSHSYSRPEADGFHALLENREQMMFDVADERERRRQQRGFASPADARAFLQASRSTPLPRAAVNQGSQSTGIVKRSASRIRRYMQRLSEIDQAAYEGRNADLAQLGNILISGCPLQGRAFTAKEAADAAVAICNIGLEQLPEEPDYLLRRDLIEPFQIGWTTLHQVCVMVAEMLAEILAELRVADADVQSELNMLRIRLMREIEQGTPWRAAGALEVLTGIDMTAAAALTGLLAECPVIHAGLRASLDRGVRSVDPHAFEFIATEQDLAAVRAFAVSVGDLLRG